MPGLPEVLAALIVDISAARTDGRTWNRSQRPMGLT